MLGASSVLPLAPAYVVTLTRELDGAPAATPPGRSPWREHLIPPAGLLVPAVVVVFGLLLEGSLDIWSGLYLGRSLAASVLVGGMSLAMFALAMAIGRIFAARRLFRLGYGMTVVICAGGALGFGLLVALTKPARRRRGPPRPRVLPLRGGACGLRHDRGDAGSAGRRDGRVAWVTAASYVAFMVGPPIMGWIADATSLRVAMVALVLLALLSTATENCP